MIRFLPPIDVTAEEISAGLGLFAAALASLPPAAS